MPHRSPWTCILWDVDGTIVDASDGILHRLQIASRHYGRPEVTRAELIHWIGPPMFETFQKQFGMSPDQATEAVSYYRDLGRREGYTTGAKLYDGVGELISEIHRAGVTQATASSKPEVQVTALMQHFGLTSDFTTIVGASPDERTLGAKADIVAEAIRRLDAAGIDTTRPVMIGDRHHDVDGASANGIPTIFVRWGFSWPHESEGAQAVVDTVTQLRELILLPESDD